MHEVRKGFGALFPVVEHDHCGSTTFPFFRWQMPHLPREPDHFRTVGRDVCLRFGEGT